MAFRCRHVRWKGTHLPVIPPFLYRHSAGTAPRCTLTDIGMPHATLDR